MNPETLLVSNVYITGQIQDRRKANTTHGGVVQGLVGTTGKYDTHYIATLSGIYDLFVNLNTGAIGFAIDGSPFAPQILSASTSGPDCTVEQVPSFTMAGSMLSSVS